MIDRLMVSFQEVVAVNSIDGIMELYSDKGYKFADEKSFLHQLSTDWKRETTRLTKEAQLTEEPENFPLLKVKVDGVTYGLHGVVHDARVLAPKYVELISRSLRQYANWISEDSIAAELQIQGKVVEIPDFVANSNLEEFGHCILIGLLLPKGIVESVYESVNKSKIFTGYLRDLNVPSEAIGTLPAFVEIELREKKRRRYTFDQARSAYHAEFLKAWKTGEDKGDLVGKSHIPEVKRFLLNGVKDSGIVDLAHSHAQLLERDPEKFYRLKSRIDTKANLMQAAGYVLGASPYVVGLELGISKIVF